MSNLVLTAPLQGWIAPLDETPDAVFAERMLGDGLAIDPFGSALHAPCDAVVVTVHRARHAVTLRAANGAEILMHVGLETVALNGEGFSVFVTEGQGVRAGDKLLGFDLDFLAQRARSLITPVVITNLDAFQIVRREQDRQIGVGEFLMELAPLRKAASANPAPTDERSRDVVVPLAHGIHARPAARIAETARPFAAEVALVAVNRRASAKSPVGVMSLAIRHGAAIQVVASGPDAEAAIAAVADLIEGGMGEGAPVAASVAASMAAPVSAPAVFTPEPTGPAELPRDGVLKGVLAAPGLAIGKAVRLASVDIVVREQGEGVAHEEAALAAALDTVRARIELNAAQESAHGGDKARKAILGAHLAFLEDPELTAGARRLIGEGKSAGHAWRKAVGGYVEALRSLSDRRLAERVDDLIDLERQVLRALSGEEDEGAVLPPGSILLADELLPSQLMGVDPAAVAGFVTARGGPTSHVAILAAAMGIPALVALGGALLKVKDGAALILDADGGSLRVAPDAPALEAAQTALAQRQARKAAAKAAAHEPCVTKDGVRIEVFANTGSLNDALAAVANGAEGCGLLRTEFLFLDRDTPPDEDEQARQYQAIADALEGRPLIIRTLDVGGDKAAPYLPIPAEENPALGLRGVRVSLWRPHLLKTQLRAILRVKPPQGQKGAQCKIMVPMISSLDELRAVRAVLDEAKRELGIVERVELGVMIETPAAAMTADVLAAEADFLSIGTNDLTQYVLAMDRGNPELAARIDALHPAVLRMIDQTCQGAARHHRWVGVCGGLASDVAATPILLGLGVTELSTTASIAPEVKAKVRTLSLDACRDLAAQALNQTSPEAVRALVKSFGA